MEQTRTCGSCGEPKPLAEFYPDANGKNIKQRRCRVCQNEYLTAKHRERRLAVIEHYGGRCVCCGTDFYPHLTLDHVEGDGTADRARFSSARQYWNWLARELPAEGFQVLCWNCNEAKHFYGECLCQTAKVVV